MIGSSELIVILVLALLLFGPKKLPELARALGNATREYHRAAKEFEKEAKEISKVADEIGKEVREISKEMEVKPDVKLTELKVIAKKLGVSTENKNELELLKEISSRIKGS